MHFAEEGFERMDLKGSRVSVVSPSGRDRDGRFSSSKRDLPIPVEVLTKTSLHSDHVLKTSGA